MNDRPALLPAAPLRPCSRCRSLDIFRGAAVALMILVNNPGSWSHLYPPLAHAAWHGLTPTDLVFPFFLFAVGNALALAPPAGWARVARRTALIIALGLFLNATPFVQWNAAGDLVLRPWDSLRLMGVLQRIALCYGAAAVVVFMARALAGRRGVPGAVAAVVAVAAVLLMGYTAACIAFGRPGDAWSLAGWFGTAVDRALLGASHLYRGEGVPFDPEGLASTTPAIAQVLLGWWVGRCVAASAAAKARAAALSPLRRAFGPALQVAGIGLLLLGLGLLCEWLGVPVNKKLWTPSYVLVSSGYAALLLAGLVVAVDGRPGAGWRLGWARLFEVFGRNALFVFALSGFVPRVLALVRWTDGLSADGSPRWTTPLRWIYEHAFAGIGSDPRLSSLLYACAHLGVYALLASWLDRRRIYLRV